MASAMPKQGHEKAIGLSRRGTFWGTEAHPSAPEGENYSGDVFSARLKSLLKNAYRSGFVTGHEFTRVEKSLKNQCAASAAAHTPCIADAFFSKL